MAAFAFNHDTGVLVNNRVKFDASTSYSRNVGLVEWRWNFGDGASSEGKVVEHTYNTCGNYLVELTVLDSQGGEGKSTAIINAMDILRAESLASPVSGLTYKYYTGEFDFLTGFNELIPTNEGTCSGLDYKLHDNDESFGLVFSGYIKIPTDGVYKFKTSVDFDTIYNQLGGTSWAIHGKPVSEYNNGWGCIGLEAGLHPFTISFLKEIRTEFLWSGPGVDEQEISEEVFFRALI